MEKLLLNALCNLDTAVYRRVIRLQSHNPTIRWLRLISRSGDGYLYAAFGLCQILIGDPKGLLVLKAGLIAFLFELPCFMGLKALIKRDRPFVQVQNSSAVITPADKFSMPSGHSAAAFLMATLVASCYPQFVAGVLGWATLVGLSRIALGVHYPSDVCAGAALGSSCAMLGMVLSS
ncbi:MAG: phosphatase PAP2 family protein [Pseudomonadales bacterium]|nr:phosphatase PAP2 family protein [Pseudomonadales bacterium]